jgi:HD-GYP domain-containing protein (c-di-GMP phosphodiesterase class II)
VGRDIPLLGRVIAVGGAYDAMTSDRAYRRALAHEVACEELERCAGTQFDPDIVAAFLREILRWRAEQLESGHTIPA